MRRDGRRYRGALGAAACATLLILPLLAACQGERQGQGRTYTVRGQLLRPPDAATRQVYLQHEAIDDFVGRDGKVLGMDPMAMPFTAAPEVPLSGLAAGDVVEFDLAVDWSADRIRITRIAELPPGTKLVFRAAEPGRGR